MSNIQELDEYRKGYWELGISICLTCGVSFKTMKAKEADPRTLECCKCEASNSVFIPIQIVLDAIEMENCFEDDE